MMALCRALLRAFLADRVALALALVAPIAFFSLFALFYNHLDSPTGLRFPVLVTDDDGGPDAQRLVNALLASTGGRIHVSQAVDAAAPPIATIRIAPGFSAAAPSVEICGSSPLPGPADATRHLVRAAVAEAFADRAPRLQVVDLTASGRLLRSAAAGVALMFALFSLSSLAARGMGDDEAGLAERLRAIGLRPRSRLLGRGLAMTLIAWTQLVVTFLFAAAVFGAVPHAPLALIAASFLAAAACAAFFLLLSAVCGTRARFASVSVVAVLLLSALGGSMIPRELLPDLLSAPGGWMFTSWGIAACTAAIGGATNGTALLLLASFTAAALLAASLVERGRAAA